MLSPTGNNCITIILCCQEFLCYSIGVKKKKRRVNGILYIGVLFTILVGVFTLVVWREEESGGACYERQYSQTQMDSTSRTALGPDGLTQKKERPEQTNRPATDSESYFCRLIAPANLPNIYLVLIGIGGIFAAIGTLHHIRRQAQSMRFQTTILRDSVKAQIAIERAWITVDEAFLSQKMGREWFIRPTVRNLGKTIARVRKISLGGQSLQREGKFPDTPSYPESRSYHDFVLLSGQEFPVDEVLVLPVTWERVKDAQTGIFTMYFFGCIEYLDLANNERTARFVLVWGLDGPYRLVPYLQAPAAYYENE